MNTASENPVPIAAPVTPEPLSRLMRPGVENPPWTGLDVVVIAAVILISIMFFTALGAVLAIATGKVGAHDVMLFLKDYRLIVSAQTAAYASAVAWMVTMVRRRSPAGFWQEVRWNWPGMGRALGYALAGMALAMAVDISSAYLPMPKTLPVDELFRSTSAAFTMAAFGILVAPFLEEMFFRGFLYPVLARGAGATLAIALTAASFSLVHQQQLAHAWMPLLILFLVGLVFTSARARTRSVACSWLMHAGYNTALFMLAFIATDGFRHMEKILR